jgi:hypothetical protein
LSFHRLKSARELFGLKKWPFEWIRVTRISWFFEKYGCLKPKSEDWCLLTTSWRYWLKVSSLSASMIGPKWLYLQFISSLIFRIGGQETSIFTFKLEASSN